MRWVTALFLVVQVAQESTARATVELKPDCLAIIDRIDFSFAETVWRADGVAHIRISEAGVEDACPVTSRCRCVMPTVRSLTSSGGNVPSDLALVLDAPLPVGEYVALLARESDRDVYSIMGGHAYAFPVREGRVQFTRSEPGFTDGMTVPDFIGALMKMRRGPVTTRGSSGTSTGAITGIVTDSAGGLMPGATITLRWSDGEQTTVTDARGMFRFNNVRQRRYAVLATLQGFYSVPHTAIDVSPASTVSLRFEMTTDCIRLTPGLADQGLQWAVGASDLIAHIRIPSLVPHSACSVQAYCSCTLHHANVLRVVKGAPVREIRLLQVGAGDVIGERAYAPGDEFIAFLTRDDVNFGYQRLVNTTYMFRIRDGRVELGNRELPGLADGMTVEAFIAGIGRIRR